MAAALKKSAARWPELSREVFVPHTEAECQRLSRSPRPTGSAPNPKSPESHPLASLMEVIGLLIGIYEDGHVPELEEGCIVREESPKQ